MKPQAELWKTYPVRKKDGDATRAIRVGNVIVLVTPRADANPAQSGEDIEKFLEALDLAAIEKLELELRASGLVARCRSRAIGRVDRAPRGNVRQHFLRASTSGPTRREMSKWCSKPKLPACYRTQPYR